jgi:hypothetical protein
LLTWPAYHRSEEMAPFLVSKLSLEKATSGHSQHAAQVSGWHVGGWTFANHRIYHLSQLVQYLGIDGWY